MTRRDENVKTMAGAAREATAVEAAVSRVASPEAEEAA